MACGRLGNPESRSRLTRAREADARARKSPDHYCRVRPWVQVVRKKLERGQRQYHSLRIGRRAAPKSHQVHAVGRQNLPGFEAFTKETLAFELHSQHSKVFRQTCAQTKAGAVSRASALRPSYDSLALSTSTASFKGSSSPLDTRIGLCVQEKALCPELPVGFSRLTLRSKRCPWTCRLTGW